MCRWQKKNGDFFCNHTVAYMLYCKSQNIPLFLIVIQIFFFVIMAQKTQKVMSQAGWKNWDHSCPRFPHWEGAFHWDCSWHPRNILHSLLYISFCKEIARNNPKPRIQHSARYWRRKSFLAQFCHSETWVRPSHWGSGDFSTPLKAIFVSCH